MRPFSARMFPNAVEVVTRTASGRSAGAAVKISEPAVAWQASVQPVKASRLLIQGAIRSETDWVVYFAADPGVKVDDWIRWLGRTLGALGPARPAAGRDTLWAVECKEIR